VTAPARALAALAIALLPVTTLLALHFRDGPPARVTGGFGEDSCLACHFGNAPNDDAGKLTLSGISERYEPGSIYELEVALSRPGMKAGGFQLAIRNADDRMPAGRIAVPAEEKSRVGVLEERGVQFAQHRLAEAPASDEVQWKLSWTAPETPRRVTIHVAAVAGDGDESQAGDFVYTLEAYTESISAAQ